MRVANRIAALILSVALVLIGLLLIVEVILIFLDQPPWLLPLRSSWQALTAVTLNDTAVLVTAIIVAVVGLAVLIAQCWPQRPVRLKLAGHGHWFVRRRNLERRIANTAADRASLTHAKVKASRSWKVRVRASGDKNEQDVVESIVRSELDRLDAPADRPIQVRIRRPSRTV